MENFVFYTPTRILFGKGQTENLAEQIKANGGHRVLMVYGGGSIKKSGLYDVVVQNLKQNGIDFRELSGIQPNPRISSVREGVAICKKDELDFVLPVGGGSAIDAAKAIAAGVHYDGDPWDFFMHQARVEKALPVGTVLTLAATGSEMNAGTVVNNEESMQKRPLMSSHIIPRFSILDPENTYSVNERQSASGIADIWSHTMEQYFSAVNTAHVSDRFAEGIFSVLLDWGPKVLENPRHYEARANIMWAGTMALNGLLQAGKDGGDWATHMIEHEVSALYDLTHGIGLAIITPHWMEYVLDEGNAPRFAAYARNVFGIVEHNDMKAARLGIDETRYFFTELGIPDKLKYEDIPKDKFEEMAEKAVVFGPVGGLKKLAKADIMHILQAAYE